jgi:hypothetical protein
MLFDNGKLEPGESILVQAGGGWKVARFSEKPSSRSDERIAL